MATQKEIEYAKWKKNIISKQRFHLWKKEIYEHRGLIMISICLLILSLILEYISGNYVQRVGEVTSPDIILDHIGPIHDIGFIKTRFIFVYGYTFIVALLFLYPLFFDTKKLHQAISQFSLIVIMRSFFISLTHLKNPVTAVPVHFPSIFSNLAFENDLFFSGHTAVPFMAFLVFKDSKIRYVFLAASIILGATALIAHRHYSIDVFSAFFIAYGTFKIGEWAFGKIEKNY